MKKIVIVLVGCGLAIGQVFAENEAADKKEKAAGKRPGGGDAGAFFKKIDTDGDKSISKEEAGEHWEKMSQRDTDKDGKISPQELMAGRQGSAGKRPGGDPGEMFKRADKNSDGKLSKDEVPAEAWARLSRLDKDNDGAVSQEEAKAGARPGDSPGKGKGQEFFARADKNNDGKISKDEVPAEAWKRMGKHDKDKDGAVSKEELRAGFAAAMGGKGKGRNAAGVSTAGGADAIFTKMDTDKDGKLSSEEVPAEMWSKLSKADEDADGLVSKAELGKVYQAREEAGRKSPDAAKKKRPELEKESA